MEWSDDAIVLSSRAHGENAAILEVLSREHGRHLGLVHGGNSRKSRAALQPGNTLHVKWRARLSEQLGSFHLELARARAGELMDGRQALAGLNAFCAVAAAAIPEREPHAAVFEAAEMLLDAMTATDAPHWLPLYVRWEAGLLEALGFGLDLSACAVTGTADDLLYVSPRSGRAVSAAAGADYAARLFRLPQFLLASQNAVVDPGEIVAGLSLTAHFLLERVLQPHGRHMPPARLHLGAIAARESD